MRIVASTLLSIYFERILNSVFILRENSFSNATDNSGMRVYYTQNLRKYDSGNVQIGQNDLEILPGSTYIDQSGGCSSFCTQNILQHPIYITRTYLHMHYLGKYMYSIPKAHILYINIIVICGYFTFDVPHYKTSYPSQAHNIRQDYP